MRANPFAILISSTHDGPFATHLPLFVRVVEDNRITLRGHVARVNPHWRYIEQQSQCLSIFHGPHSYISPSNYSARDSVPTWNYAAVHVYGEARIFSLSQELREMLHDLIETFEPGYRKQWDEANPSFRENMLRQIVGFEITPTRIEGKFKLSQNRTREDQSRVIASLEKSDDSAVCGVAKMMREQGLGSKADKEKE
jgi:transcriptional regulator